MKILITTDLYTTATNGVVTSVRNLWDELKHRGHDVRILTLSDKMHSYREDDVYYIRSVSLEAVYPNVRMPMTYRHHLIEKLIDWKPDVIHSQCEFFSFQFALRISKYTDAPIIHTIAMDFWASLEHQLKYKQAVPNEEAIITELKACAEVISVTDERMLYIRQQIEDAVDAPTEEDILFDKISRLEIGFE